MKLDNRLSTVVGFIPSGVVVADVGCDHGKVLYHCLTALHSPFVFGSDISQKSVEKTTNLLTKNHFTNFKTLTSDGLNGYTTQELNIIGCVVIAGMGGYEMVHILTNLQPKLQQLTKLTTLVLQPQNNTSYLRDWLQNNNFGILTDITVKEKEKFYHVLKVAPNKKQNLTKQQMQFGMTNLNQPTSDFMAFLAHEQTKKQTMINSLEQNVTKKPNKQHINSLKKQCNELEKLQKKLQNKVRN